MSGSFRFSKVNTLNDFYQPKKITLTDIAKNDSLVDGQMTVRIL